MSRLKDAGARLKRKKRAPPEHGRENQEEDLGSGIFLLLGLRVTAFVVEAFFLAAALAIGLGWSCLGSFTFHLLSGRASFALRTLPGARGNSP